MPLLKPQDLLNLILLCALGILCARVIAGITPPPGWVVRPLMTPHSKSGSGMVQSVWGVLLFGVVFSLAQTRELGECQPNALRRVCSISLQERPTQRLVRRCKRYREPGCIQGFKEKCTTRLGPNYSLGGGFLISCLSSPAGTDLSVQVCPTSGARQRTGLFATLNLFPAVERTTLPAGWFR